MDIYEITVWLNSVIDAQVALQDELPEQERDPCWGFFREWEDELIDAAWAAGG